MMEWEWYKDMPVKTLFLHMIFRANVKKQRWKGIAIDRGQFVSTYRNLAHETGLSIKQIRTAIDKLILTNEILKETIGAERGHNEGSLFTLVSYKTYQAKGQSEGRARAERGHGEGTAGAHIIEEEEYKEGKEGKKSDTDFFENDITQQIKSSGQLLGEMMITYEKHIPTPYTYQADTWKGFIRKIKNYARQANEKQGIPNAKITDEQIIMIFDLMLTKMDKFYKDKLSPKLLDSNFDTIFAQVHNQINSKSNLDAEIEETLRQRHG